MKRVKVSFTQHRERVVHLEVPDDASDADAVREAELLIQRDAHFQADRCVGIVTFPGKVIK